MKKKIVKLKGEELASYFKSHRKDFESDGDALCLAAGYGIELNDGTTKCNFTDFVKALSSVVSE